MDYKAVIFDKDGTLFDYYTVWAPVFRDHMDILLHKLGRSGDDRLRGEILNMLGIDTDGINPDGLIFRHNGPLMLVTLYIFSKRNRISYPTLIQGFREGFEEAKNLIKESLVKQTDPESLIPLFRKLKEAGYLIGIVTSDNSESTKICLDHFQITPYIDMISTYDDHFKKKPHPQSFEAFCRKFSLKPGEVIVIGDAPVDMTYAKRGGAGYKIGVLTGSGDLKRLQKGADVIYEDISSVMDDRKIFA